MGPPRERNAFAPGVLVVQPWSEPEDADLPEASALDVNRSDAVKSGAFRPDSRPFLRKTL